VVWTNRHSKEKGSFVCSKRLDNYGSALSKGVLLSALNVTACCVCVRACKCRVGGVEGRGNGGVE